MFDTEYLINHLIYLKLKIFERRGIKMDTQILQYLIVKCKLLTKQIQSLELNKNKLHLKNHIIHYCISNHKTKLTKLKYMILNIISNIPNILDLNVPIGNKSTCIYTYYIKKKYLTFDHRKILNKSFMQAQKLSGTGFNIISNDMAKLERVITQFMINLHTNLHKFIEINVPLLVKTKSLFGTAQLPKFKNELFSTQDNLWLIPTSEVSLLNSLRSVILKNLPIRLTSVTPCFRTEVNTGLHKSGLIRQKQFLKCELISIIESQNELREQEYMLLCIEKTIKLLNLNYRISLLSSMKTGFSSKKTFDIEVYIPSLKKYIEVSSCSNCGNFQSIRLNIRFKKQYPSTINGSGTTIGRILLAIIENYYDGSNIIIPEVLKKYMEKDKINLEDFYKKIIF